MATLTNLSALRETGALDDLIRRVHQDKEDFVIEDLTMPVAAVVDINKFQLLNDLLSKADSSTVSGGDDPMILGSNVTVREVAERHLAGDSMDDLRHRFGLLRLSQIHAALAYYYDHSEQIDRLILARRNERSAAQPGASLRAAADGATSDTEQTE
ncbi:MAG: DUF433 domain-containing protein [Herpetosiphonaceae bacterium]|nr:DUF433 domain-containing protein [Herpetosiphonaceae bacterium]